MFQAWEEFLKGKRAKADVGVYERNLEDNIFDLHRELSEKTYRHGNYQEFYVRDPKVRHIHKACVKDRVVHHLTSKVLEEIFDPTFYPHSYSCRKGKGTHRAVQAFVKMSRKASKNNTSKLLILKCDIKKFFASVDHEVLIKLLKKRILVDDKADKHNIDSDTFFQETLSLMRLTKAAIIYLINFVNTEEEKKHKASSKPIMNMYVDTSQFLSCCLI